MLDRLKLIGIVTLFALTLLPLAHAQGVYLGGSGSLPLNSGFSAQLGVSLFSPFELRAVLGSGENITNIESAGADALFNVGLPSSRLYLGAGAEALFNTPPSSIEDARASRFGVHAIGGGELRVGSLGIFGEVQPGFLLEPSEGTFQTRVGVNLHF